MKIYPLFQTVAEYFAGIGLVRMGLESHSWQVVYANDISEKKYAMYEAFFPDAHHHYTIQDIFDIEPASIPKTMLATCSFPCIDLSLAGNRNGIEGKYSSAFWGFIKILKAQGDSAPPLVLVENVPGWLNSNNGADFHITVSALNSIGYACDVFIVDALRFTPQSRERVFLLGAKHSGVTDAPFRIVNRPRSLLSDRLKRSVLENVDLDWFYVDLPPLPPLRTEGLSEIVEELDKDDERWWSEEEVMRHLDMMSPLHRKRVEDLRSGQQISYRTFFRRIRQGKQRAEVRQDEVAGCLRTAVGGSGKQFLLRAGHHRIQMRTMTPREYARLQGVPDKYPIYVPSTQALTGFGDAVCVPVVSWIAEHALNPLAIELAAGESEFYMR